MSTRTRMQWLAGVAAGTMLLAAGCQRNEGDKATTSALPADKMASSSASMAPANPPGVADDAAITSKVKEAVAADPSLQSTDIKVDTGEGVVTLAGTVASGDLKQRAAQAAQSVQGVKSVSDQLVVKSS
ncbi:MAG TPA: BON domain-containing protein [Casimicrobiaceae bacterium]|nr:BON domain-containing protein [Casimicrobiaceae bacterium]